MKLLFSLALSVATALCATSFAAPPPTEYYQPPGKDYLVPLGKPDPLAIRADEPKKDEKKFGRGVKPIEKGQFFKHLVNRGFKPSKELKLPVSVAYVPTKLSYWLNNQYGDCVTAEEAFNQDCAGTFLQDKTIQSWAQKYGFLNGAYLTEVMDQMAKSGFSENGNVYGVGSYVAVNYADEASLQSALSVAPVKIGIDANALPSGAGNNQGWWAAGGRVGQYGDEDHCTALCGYGPVAEMFKAVGINAVPAGWPAKSKTAYLHFTWSTIGVVDHDWIMSTCQESYLRNPTATINGKAVPNPGPGPDPLPTITLTAAPPSGVAPLMVTFSGVSPLATWSLDFGDKTPSHAGTSAGNLTVSHTYAAAGSYTATLTSGTQTANAGVTVTLVPPPPPPPPPGPNGGYTGTVYMAQDYVNGVAVGDKRLIVGAPPVVDLTALGADLKAAGFNIAIVADILKLLADMKAKAGFAVYLQDLLKIAADFGLMKEEEEKKNNKAVPQPIPEAKPLGWLRREEPHYLAA